VQNTSKAAVNDHSISDAASLCTAVTTTYKGVLLMFAMSVVSGVLTNEFTAQRTAQQRLRNAQ
jgi:hypothetical protein